LAALSDKLQNGDMGFTYGWVLLNEEGEMSMKITLLRREVYDLEVALKRWAKMHTLEEKVFEKSGLPYCSESLISKYKEILQENPELLKEPNEATT
jgi:hypothetical protein